ncbi:MAG TPA: S41 family peptidase [Thermodesulfobacteriota bacterium]|nr:S41 family peptidase [Thermodesulfobacteriota bacterium]
MCRAALTLLFISLLVTSCMDTVIESPKEVTGRPVPVTSLSRTYREVALLVRDESLYVSSNERWEGFIRCLNSQSSNGTYGPVDNDGMPRVNLVLKTCLPEDKKIKYFSPAWYKAQNACPDLDRRTPKEKIKPIRLSYRIMKHINTGYIPWRYIDYYGFSNMIPILRTFSRSNVDTVILDMRDNPGGSVENVESFLGLVLKGREDPYFIMRKSHRRTVEFIVNKDGEFSHFNIIVLVNKRSASATEIVAGVLQRQGAIVIGEQTYGKGTVQESGILYFIDRNCPAMLELTTRQVFFDDGKSPQGIGITPDITVGNSEDALEKAIEYISRRMPR